MILQSNAKINLGLFITEKREDGYHNLESLFIPVPWNDEIQLEAAAAFSFESSGIPIPQSSNANLCEQAFRLLQAEFEIPPVSIKLNKKVPIGAGLGGGSSNAAFVLKGLNDLFHLGLGPDELELRAQQLGSDCPFFIRNRPAFVSGTGNIFEFDVRPQLDCWAIIINPGIHVSSAEAFAGIKPKAASFDLRKINELPLQEWKNKIKNDFELPITRAYPELADLRESLYKQGAAYVSMSGSGSSFFALFKQKPEVLDYKSSYLACAFDLKLS